PRLRPTRHRSGHPPVRRPRPRRRPVADRRRSGARRRRGRRRGPRPPAPHPRRGVPGPHRSHHRARRHRRLRRHRRAEGPEEAEAEAEVQAEGGGRMTMDTTLGVPTPPGPAGVAAGASLNRGASYLVASWQVAARTLRKFVRTPALIIAGTAQGVLFLLIFRYVFGGAVAHTGGLSYVDFLVPGFVVTGVLFQGMGAATGIAEDLKAGLIDRL